MVRELWKSAIKIGMDEQTFWNSDFEGIQSYFDAYTEREKQKQKENILSNYNLASMVSSFVSGGLNGKAPPSINTLYPELFPVNTQAGIRKFEADIINFANAWNNKRKQSGE